MTNKQGSAHIPESWPEDWPYSAVTEAEKLTEQRDDLLEALKQLEETINDDIMFYPDSGPYRVMQSRLQKARSAITEAGG